MLEKTVTEMGGIVENVEDGDEKKKDPQLWRDLLAYWFLGLCNNYGYVVMLTAAHDILGEFSGDHNNDTNNTPSPYDDAGGFERRPCNQISTGAILLADILPALLVKSVSSFFPLAVHLRISVCVILSIAGFLTTAYAEAEWVVYLGVVSTSLASGLGEATFLSYSTYYNKNVVSTWSSGTGGAGIIGAISYTGLTGVGLTPKSTLLVMLVVPAIESLAFWGILRHHRKVDESIEGTIKPEETIAAEASTLNEDEVSLITWKDKLFYIPALFKYMIPLVLVYLFEYFINQGLFELIYFPNIWIDQSEQYRWFQVLYQVGVFISRSSVNLYQFKHVWIMALLQLINVLFFTFEAVYYFTPNIWIIFVLIIWEGLLGGGAYVNTFYRMSHEITPKHREFAMMVTSLSDSLGIALAGIAAIPSHNAICSLPVPDRLLKL